MGLLSQLQSEIVDRLLADDYFAAVPVIGEDLGDLSNLIERNLGKCGTVVIVAVLSAAVDHPDVEGPYFDDIRVQITTIVRPTISTATGGLNKPAKAIAEQIHGLLHHWTPDSLDAPVWTVAPGLRVEPPNSGMTSCANFFRTSGAVAVTLSTVATPAITNTDGTITITCATAGAAIFYTTNGDHPSPRAGTLYTTGFIPGTGLTVKARAWLAGYLASNLATLAT